LRNSPCDSLDEDEIMTNNRLTSWFLIPAAALLVSTAVSAQVPVRRPQQVPATGAEDSRVQTPADAQGVQRLDAITNRSFAGLTYDQRADGTLSINLQGRFQNVMMAAPGPDGRLNAFCQTSESLTKPISATPWLPIKGKTPGLLDTSALRAQFQRELTTVSKPAVLEVK
jgi:hypothetical protein